MMFIFWHWTWDYLPENHYSLVTTLCSFWTLDLLTYFRLGYLGVTSTVPGGWAKMVLTQRAESTRKRAVPVQSICRPINFEGYYIYINMIGQQLTDSCNWDQLSCFRISADRQELASFYTLEQKFETNVMWLQQWSGMVWVGCGRAMNLNQF